MPYCMIFRSRCRTPGPRPCRTSRGWTWRSGRCRSVRRDSGSDSTAAPGLDHRRGWLCHSLAASRHGGFEKAGGFGLDHGIVDGHGIGAQAVLRAYSAPAPPPVSGQPPHRIPGLGRTRSSAACPMPDPSSGTRMRRMRCSRSGGGDFTSSTGFSVPDNILLAVLPTWKRRAPRRRARPGLPCRLLFPG